MDLGTEIGPDIVEEIVRYMYTGNIDDVEEIADRVIVAAHKFEFPDLKIVCQNALMFQLNTDNALNMYFLAIKVNATELQEKAFNLMKT